MVDILQIADKLAKTNVRKVLIRILKRKRVQKFITGLNTDVQLFDQGEDSKGRTLASIGGGYSPVTIEIKARKGQPTNRVTLRDTGEFHKSFEVIVKPNADFVIDSDPIKEGGTNLLDEWGEDVEGLQPENLKKVMELLEREFYNEVFKGL